MHKKGTRGQYDTIVDVVIKLFKWLMKLQELRQIVGMEQFPKMLTTSQYDNLKQSLTQLAKEAANRNFNKADVSVYAY